MIFKEVCVNSSKFSVFVNFHYQRPQVLSEYKRVMFKACLIIIHCHVTANHLYFHYHHGSVQLQLAE